MDVIQNTPGKNLLITKLDDARVIYEYVKDIIANFNGNAEKFYPQFYKAVSEEICLHCFL